MMLQFPTPYKDELLYSVIARYGIRSGNTSHRAVLEDVFGSDRFTACLELQPGVSHIISNLPANSAISADQLIFQNTMYPFFTAFRDEKQAQHIYDSLLDNHGKDLNNAIGLMSSTVKPVAYFQYCPLCSQEDLDVRGELYWRRMHQIPGVRICTKHGIWLSESKVPTRRIKQEFKAPKLETCPFQNVHIVSDNNMLGQYSCIINNIERLLNYQYPNRPMDWFYRCYKSHLIQKGYATDRGRVDHKRLRKDFVDFFGVELLEILQSSVSVESGWLKLIFQKHRKGFHPIRHLLVVQFLGLMLDDVFFGDPSQACIAQKNIKHQPKRKISKKNMTPEYKERAKKERRDAWLQMRTSHPNYSRLELRKLNPKIYAWLYRYDRKFLIEHMPEKLPPKAGAIRYDWVERDQEILEQVTKAVMHLQSEKGKPQRLTLGRIEEMLGKQCLMPKHLNKMPQTKVFLAKVVEDSKKFRKRRIEWAIEELKKDEEPLNLNRIKMKAGVNIKKDSTEYYMLISFLNMEG